jgi:hypothetical protein
MGIVLTQRPKISDPTAHQKLSRLARESMVFLLQHSATKTPIDLAIGGTAFEQQALAHRQSQRFGNRQIPVPRVEDLLIFKAIARRPVDQADMAMLLHRHPKLNMQHILRWLGEFSELLEDVTMIHDFKQLVQASKPRK